MLRIHSKRVGLKHYNDSKGFNEYSNYMDDIYKNFCRVKSN